jgi:hypothetical protein
MSGSVKLKAASLFCYFFAKGSVLRCFTKVSRNVCKTDVKQAKNIAKYLLFCLFRCFAKCQYTVLKKSLFAVLHLVWFLLFNFTKLSSFCNYTTARNFNFFCLVTGLTSFEYLVKACNYDVNVHLKFGKYVQNSKDTVIKIFLATKYFMQLLYRAKNHSYMMLSSFAYSCITCVCGIKRV